MSTPCPADCGGTSGDGGLCAGCTSSLMGMLRLAPSAVAQLRVTVTRQARMAAPGASSGGSTTQPLPYDEGASRTAADLRRVLQESAIRHGHPAGDGSGTVAWIAPARSAAWLLDRTGDVRVSPYARLTLDQVAALLDLTPDPESGLCVGQVWRRVDRAPDRWFAGLCSADTPRGPCPEDLLAVPGAGVVRCRACGTQHDVAQRRSVLQDAVRGILGTATWLASALSPLLGAPIDSAKVRVWKQRGRLVPRGMDRSGAPLYLAGDVLDLALAQSRRKANA